jgi:HEAT repeat protein
MFGKTTVALFFAALLSLPGAALLAQDQTGRTYTRADFINVEGGSLAEKIERAVRQFKDSRQGETFWIAYHFQARQGVQIGPFSGMVYSDSDGIRLSYRDRPEGAAVFFLTDASGSRPAFTRVKTLDLNEPYLFENRPVYWLGDIDTAQSLQQLETIMRADRENKDLVRGALRAISAHNSPRVVPLLKEIALKETIFDIQRYAISSLGRVPTKESLDALDEIFNTATNLSLKQEAIRAYTASGDRISERRVLDRLTALATKADEDPAIRKEALRRIASFRGDAVTDRLFEIFDRTTDRDLKLEIIRQVSARDSRDDRVLKRLTALAKSDADPGMQREAIRRLSAVKGEESVSLLIEIYDSASSEAVKEEVINRLAQSESRKALDKLLAIAKNDPSPKLRQSAIRRLSSGRVAGFSLR